VYAVNHDKLAPYVYADTRELVALVEDAAALIERKGEAAFQDFAIKDSKWFNDKYYLFVYDLDGNCAFHPIHPKLVGQNLSLFRDMEQKPVIELISAVGKKPEPDASDWVFYLWEQPSYLTPQWKTAYIRKAITPTGKVYAVGSGLYNMKIEKKFIEDRVNMAATLVLTKGKEEGFRELQDRSCPLHVLDSYIFVINSQGDFVVDPAFPMLVHRNVANFRDFMGRSVVEEVGEQLQHTDRTWVTVLIPSFGTNKPIKLLAYVRKIQVGEESFFVYSTLSPPKPVWMKE
jgi:signal transduction histidine kinase